MTKKTDQIAGFTGPAADAFKLWISFWPVAPFFGVEWRFAKTFPQMPMMPVDAFMPKAPEAMTKAEPAPKAPSAPAAPAAPTPAPVAEAPAVDAGAEMAAAADAAVEAATEALESAAEAVEEMADPVVGNGASEGEGFALESEESAAVRPGNLFETEPAEADDLKQIKGIGPSLESKLNALGIYRLDQIATFSEENLTWVDDQLTTFKGRCFRDDWVGQAKSLLG